MVIDQTPAERSEDQSFFGDFVSHLGCSRSNGSTVLSPANSARNKFYTRLCDGNPCTTTAADIHRKGGPKTRRWVAQGQGCQGWGLCYDTSRTCYEP
jgi:hypothetical protein